MKWAKFKSIFQVFASSFAGGFFIASLSTLAHAFDYKLNPQKIADGVYVVMGSTQDFSAANGGNIVNTGFVVTNAGVVVIDTGPTKAYGEQLRAAIKRITPQPIARVFITHPHPDHYLGTQVFKDVGVFALPRAIETANAQGNAYLDNLYRMVLDAARGTEHTPPNKSVTETRLRVGEREFELFALTGHTAGDLAILDVTSGVLFAGDLTFFNRTPATPHATVDAWLASLDRLEKVAFKKLVSGHGPVADDKAPIAQTRAYLQWLDQTLIDAARAGKDMSELLNTPAPERFQSLAIFKEEFQRTLAHLFPRYEKAQLK
jgi:quinoprotein relay system zinc metallohydrolase 1